MFCARCGVTPYCGEACQRRDWAKRHSAVCHNLRVQVGSSARSVSSAEQAVDNNNVAPIPAPLRRPHSPGAGGGAARDSRHIYMDKPASGNMDKGSGETPRDRQGQSTHVTNSYKPKFVPAGHQPAPRSLAHQNNYEDAKGFAARKPDQRPQRAHPGITDIKNGLPRPKHDMNAGVERRKAKIDLPQAKVDLPQAKVDLPQAKVDLPQAKVDPPQTKVETPSPKPNSVAANLVFETSKTIIALTPQAPLVPSHYLVEKLPIGDSFVISVEQADSAALVCLAMHAQFADHFNSLMGDIYDGEDHIVPTPGQVFAYLDPGDQGWYRARCLAPTKCALMDGGRLAEITARSECRPLAPHYKEIPEFCCVLRGKAEVGMSLKCTILMKTPEGYKVSIESADEDLYLGEGLITRWKPEVELPTKPPSIQDRLDQGRVVSSPTPAKIQPTPEAKSQPTPASKSRDIPDAPKASKSQKPSIPDVPRPDVVNNGRYMLLHVSSLGRACVRPCDDTSTTEFENILQDTALYGVQSAKPLPTAPVPGEEVLCLFEGIHYRALVTRTKAAEDRFKVQYVEYGNEEVVSLDKLFACPPSLQLRSRPARAALLSLSHSPHQLTPPATEYVDSLKECVELVAKIPSGAKSAPSGALVTLIDAARGDNVNTRLEALCTPEWKKLQDAGGDVVDTDVILFSSMSTVQLPTDHEFTLEVTDYSLLEKGIVSGFEQGVALAEYIFGPLTDKITEYCNSPLCSEPYLPAVEELCLAKLEPYEQWFRAVVVSHRAGDASAILLYVDYGSLADAVPVGQLRKCLPEFAEQPALAASADIKDWPKQVSRSQLLRAVECLQIDEEGRGKLRVRRCARLDDDMTYVVEAPDLLAAMAAD